MVMIRGGQFSSCHVYMHHSGIICILKLLLYDFIIIVLACFHECVCLHVYVWICVCTARGASMNVLWDHVSHACIAYVGKKETVIELQGCQQIQ